MPAHTVLLTSGSAPGDGGARVAGGLAVDGGLSLVRHRQVLWLQLPPRRHCTTTTFAGLYFFHN
jgi:hypothetical protein